ncbi:hypothetical protein TNCV_1689441 [Trichonephila clavipes]|nr:hypothetical protein TNCV_1689441 [Trichonephila clavipes]
MTRDPQFIFPLAPTHQRILRRFFRNEGSFWRKYVTSPNDEEELISEPPRPLEITYKPPRRACAAWGNLNIRRAASRLEKLVGREASDHSQGVIPQNRPGTEPKHTVSCMVLKAAANDRLKTSPLTR